MVTIPPSSHTLTIAGNAGGDDCDGWSCHAHSVLEEAEGCRKHPGTQGLVSLCGVCVCVCGGGGAVSPPALREAFHSNTASYSSPFCGLFVAVQRALDTLVHSSMCSAGPLLVGEGGWAGRWDLCEGCRHAGCISVRWYV